VLDHHHCPVTACGRGPRDVAADDGHGDAFARGAGRYRRYGIGAGGLVQRGTGLDRIALADGERLHAQVGFLAAEFTAGESAGIAGIVDDPDAYVALSCLFGELLEEGEVFRREVRLLHGEAGLRGDRVEAEALHGIEVMLHGLEGNRPVEAVVGLGAILGRRVDPDLLDLRGGGHLHLLPGMLDTS